MYYLDIELVIVRPDVLFIYYILLLFYCQKSL